MNLLRHLIVATAVAALIGTVSGAEKGAEPRRVAQGEKVDIKEYLVDGKTVIFDFTSRYCPPCEAIAPYLHKLHAKVDDIVVVEVDINRPDVRGIDWRSPVAQQYGMRSIPHFKIFDGAGKLVAEGESAYKQVVALIEKHVVPDEG